MERRQEEPGALRYYILFHNYTQGLALYELLKGEGLPARIAPTPRSIQGELSCGMSLLVAQAHIDGVRAVLQARRSEYHSIVALAGQIRPERDKFC
jgi:hypothetical protein